MSFNQTVIFSSWYPTKLPNCKILFSRQHDQNYLIFEKISVP